MSVNMAIHMLYASMILPVISATASWNSVALKASCEACSTTKRGGEGGGAYRIHIAA